MFCPFCSARNEPAVDQCASCGATLLVKCARCGTPSAFTARYCGQCASVLSDPAPAGGGGPTGERRQLTVLFCDVVGSTALSSQLDPEDMLEVLRAYQERCASVASQYDGYIAQYLGDGVLIYFGYPSAQEDAAQRAVMAGLALLESVRELSDEKEHAGAASLQLRVGIHTGAAVVGEVGGGTKRELLAVGETPNVAARLQAIARPGSVVISDATRRLVAGYFNLIELGPVQLKGFQEPVPLFEVTGDSGARTRLQTLLPSGLTPFVDREGETTMVSDAWREAISTVGCAIVLSGEAGIGKSRLIRRVQEEASIRRDACIECYCSPLFRNTALYPVLDMLRRVVGIERKQTAIEQRERLRTALATATMDVATCLPLLAPLLSIPLDPSSPRPQLSPQRERQQVFETLCTWIRGSARRQPCLLVVEDLHWADASTLELLGLLLSR